MVERRGGQMHAERQKEAKSGRESNARVGGVGERKEISAGVSKACPVIWLQEVASGYLCFEGGNNLLYQEWREGEGRWRRARRVGRGKVKAGGGEQGGWFVYNLARDKVVDGSGKKKMDK
ncbi:hypothetical protein Pcinc_037686 [Petrolisthes cinctipes]|uniref:Uncharacterized protein n=1 Tax=Petrolisthes cinctipes TaxID=88211 RepID=A0AAE1BS26_PETCI|nr:hypothetical protein Pcinc_037686 [Petrolisthes cinctipes]